MSTESIERIHLERLGRYRLLERIGGGATSTVYHAHDDGMDRDVAVKVIVAELKDDREARERFYREAKVTAQLHHTNIVPVLDIGEDGGHPYIVMERLHGWPLPDYLRQEGGVTLARKIDLIKQLCSGLQAAHDRGVVHRDIKPSNLFVSQDGTLKILDFGLARLQASTLTASGQILGTPDFMAPEQAIGQQVDVRSDIFSASAVSYLIVTDRSPFTRADLPSTLNALIVEDPAPIDEVDGPPALFRVLQKGLAKKPADRYQSCREMLVDLEEVRA